MDGFSFLRTMRNDDDFASVEIIEESYSLLKGMSFILLILRLNLKIFKG